MRSLTHRSVDEEAGLPPGSVNYYAPTRAKLLQLAFNSVARDTMQYATNAFMPIIGKKPTPDEVLDCTVDFIFTAAEEGRGITVARNVLNAEAQFDDDLLAMVLATRDAFVLFTDELIKSSEATLHERSAILIVALVDGLIFQQAMMVRPPLSRQAIREALERSYGFYDEDDEQVAAADTETDSDNISPESASA